MFGNYFKVAIRNLLREKGYAFINIAGLSVGIASCILILLFILNELSYDLHHEKSERIFRAGVEAVFGDSHFNSALTSGVLKDALDYEFSEVEQACRLYYSIRPVVRSGRTSFVEEEFFYADSNFFEVFTVPLIKGDPKTALSRPNTMVISEETAYRYFGDDNPLGKVLRVNEQYDFEITGVSADMPYNSHFRYDFLGSIITVRSDHWNMWTNNDLYTYILLHGNIDHSQFEDKMQDLVYKYVAAEVEIHMNIDIESFEAMGGRYSFFLEPLPDIHLYSTSDNQLNPGGNITYIYFFSIIAIFILVIACINFMNLATARYANRAKEVGVRKVVGSNRSQLIQQFLTESVLISMVAILIALTLVELTLPVFNDITSKVLEMSYLDNWHIFPGLLALGIVVGVLAGSYPAFFLSSFEPAKVLKGEVNAGQRSGTLRKALVVVQFAITIILIVSTLLISDQIRFWQLHDPGYEKEGLVILKRTNILGDQQEAFRNEIVQLNGIINASYCSAVPGYNFSGTSFHKYGSPAEDLVQTSLMWTDQYYLETMGMELAEGRYFSDEFGADDDAIIVNQTIARVMGLDDPLNESIVFPHINLVSPVIGVLENVNFESLHREIRPLTIRNLNSPGWLMAIRIQTENTPGLISSIEQTWTGFAGEAPFIYSFLDKDLEKLYTQEMRTGRLFSIFAFLAILIACLGLLGMASFTAEKRTKEIGIRKAMGASVTSIFTLLTREIVVLIVIATMIAWPLAWFVMKTWLENFAYSIRIGLATFIIATVIAFVIALLTVSYQARKAAVANPVDSLKYE